MSIFLDIIFAVIIIAFAVSGLKKGFIKSIMSFATFILALIISYNFTPLLSGYFNQHIISEKISQSVSDSINEIIGEGIDSISIDSLFKDKPTGFTDILERYGVKFSDAEELYNSKSAIGSSDVVSELSDFIAAPISNTISNVLAFVTIFLASVIVLMCLTLILDTVFKLPVLNLTNKITGLILGIAVGLLFAFVLSLVLEVVFPLLNSINPDLFTDKSLEQSYVYSVIKEYNPIKIIFSTFFNSGNS